MQAWLMTFYSHSGFCNGANCELQYCSLARRVAGWLPALGRSANQRGIRRTTFILEGFAHSIDEGIDINRADRIDREIRHRRSDAERTIDKREFERSDCRFLHALSRLRNDAGFGMVFMHDGEWPDRPRR